MAINLNLYAGRNTNVKKIIKKITPSRLHPHAKRIYRKIIDAQTTLRVIRTQLKQNFKKPQYDSLPVLMCGIGYNQYGGYCVPISSKHRPAASKILSGEIHEPNTIEFMTANCSDGDIVHAGTFFGDFLPALSQSLSPGAKIWAFEPNPENYRCAQITTYINGLTNIELANAGLGERNEALSMVTTDDRGRALGGGSRLIGKNGEATVGLIETVQMVTVDEQLEIDRKVSIIQLDIEGHEKQALSGAIKTIRRHLPIIILEDWAESDLIYSEWFSENILELGYRESEELPGNRFFISKPKP